MSEAGIVKLVLVYGVRVLPTRFRIRPGRISSRRLFRQRLRHVADHPGMESVIDSERPVALSSYDSFGHIREYTI